MSGIMAEDSLVGKQIREYEILGIIGKGGMGTVYRARHMYLDEERAIKVIRGQFSENRDYLERFIREARILTRLRHPNLVLLYEFGNLEQNTFFMVLELINGESVLARIRRMGRIPIDESVKIIREAALGLHAAHQQGIIHRDISPDNLLIVKQEGTGRELTKVIDFGIAKPLMEVGFTRRNMYIGKPEYGSPERIGIDGEEGVDHRADIYSLGVTLYYMLAGVLPFTGKSAWETMNKHLQENPKPVSDYFAPAEFPEALNKIILKSMSKKQSERHASMEEFVKELDQIFAPAESFQQDLFLEQMGHELRTRLNLIIGYSEILEEDAQEQGHQQYLRDLKKIHAAGRHLLWLIGGSDSEGDEDQKGTDHKGTLEQGKRLYDRMKWEDAIEIWKSLSREKGASSELNQWIAAAEAKIQAEKQIKHQVAGIFEQFSKSLNENRLLEAKSLLDDAARILRAEYRLEDLTQQLENMRNRMNREIEKVLAGDKGRAELSSQLGKTIELLEEHLPELKQTLARFRQSLNTQKLPETQVDKTLFIGEASPKSAAKSTTQSRKKPRV
jgi:serine/threonine protein kinase